MSKLKWAHNGVPYEKKEWRINFLFPAWLRDEQVWIRPFTRYTRYSVWNPHTQRFRTVWTVRGWRWRER